MKEILPKVSSTNESLESSPAEEAFVSLEKYQKLESRYTALFKLNQSSLDCADLKTFFGEVHQIIASLMTAKNFSIVMYDQAFDTLEFSYFVDEKDVWPEGVLPYESFKGSLTYYVIGTSKPLLATYEVIEQLLKDREVESLGSECTVWLGVPLINDGFVIGIMSVQSYSESVCYQQQDLELLTFTAQHIVGAMTRLQDHERLQNAVNARTRELMQQIREREKSELLQESLFRISELTTDISIDLNEFYRQVHNIVGQLINAANFYIVKFDIESALLSFVYYQDDYSKNKANDFEPIKLSSHLTELVLRRIRTVLLSDEDLNALYETTEILASENTIYSWLGVPLYSSDEVLGAMVVQSYEQDISYTVQDAELLNFVSQHVLTAIKRREMADFERQAHNLLEQQVKTRTAALEEEIKHRTQAEELLKHTASHDSLTGLPNRTIFIDLLNHAIACHKRQNKVQFAILFLDLDRFKVVNDSLGHHAGDLVLQIVAKELSIIVRDKDTVARFGGEEFVILVEDLATKNEAYHVAKRITELLETPFIIENQPVFVGTSIGILFSDERYTNADTMLRDADTAMYYAKDKGKGRYEVFDASMHKKVQNALMLESDIREAIGLNEFIPYFQPIVKLADNETVGFEALARWKSHKRGFVFPDDFIPLAEETNLVMAIDFQILEKSCEQLKQWQIKLNRDDLYVSCNLFCNHFFSTSLPEDIANIINKVGIEPEKLRVELTERALLENSEIVLQNMRALKELGIKILLDDFGTGYSSLSYLHRFPLDILKIDRSFISNVHEHGNHQAIIKTIIDLATNLQMTTVGEGIENSFDAELLKQMDCMYGQGYYFAKPMTSEEVENYLLSS